MNILTDPEEKVKWTPEPTMEIIGTSKPHNGSSASYNPDYPKAIRHRPKMRRIFSFVTVQAGLTPGVKFHPKNRALSRQCRCSRGYVRKFWKIMEAVGAVEKIFPTDRNYQKIFYEWTWLPSNNGNSPSSSPTVLRSYSYADLRSRVSSWKPLAMKSAREALEKIGHLSKNQRKALTSLIGKLIWHENLPRDQARKLVTSLRDKSVSPPPPPQPHFYSKTNGTYRGIAGPNSRKAVSPDRKLYAWFRWWLNSQIAVVQREIQSDHWFAQEEEHRNRIDRRRGTVQWEMEWAEIDALLAQWKNPLRN